MRSATQCYWLSHWPYRFAVVIVVIISIIKCSNVINWNGHVLLRGSWRRFAGYALLIGLHFIYFQTSFLRLGILESNILCCFLSSLLLCLTWGLHIFISVLRLIILIFQLLLAQLPAIKHYTSISDWFSLTKVYHSIMNSFTIICLHFL